jgi:hypothetical protein
MIESRNSKFIDVDISMVDFSQIPSPLSRLIHDLRPNVRCNQPSVLEHDHEYDHEYDHEHDHESEHQHGHEHQYDHVVHEHEPDEHEHEYEHEHEHEIDTSN